MVNATQLKKAGISDEAICTLETAYTQLQAIASKPKHTTPHIVCTGIYNAGKSTLLNAITDTTHFPTGDVPTTKEIAKLEWNGGIYIDTPGLNAMESDDQATAKAYAEADCVLFVSNVQNGGISEAEAQWLQGLRKQYTSQERFAQRFIYVLSQCHQVEESQHGALEQQFRKDFKKIMGFDLERYIFVDSRTYEDGMAEKEPLLVEASHIKFLREVLQERCAMVAKAYEKDAKADLKACKQGVLQAIQPLEIHCQQMMKSASGIKIKEITRLMDEAKAEIIANTKKRDEFVYAYELSIETPPMAWCNDIKEKSERKARDRARSRILSYASRMTSTVERAIREFTRERGMDSYFSNGSDSIYFLIKNYIEKLLESLLESLLKNKLSVSPLPQLTVSPDLSMVTLEKVRYVLNDNINLQSAEKYVNDCFFNITIDEDEEGFTERGLFGILYTCSAYTVRDEVTVCHDIAGCINYDVRNGIEAINRRLTTVYTPYCEALRKEALAILETMRKEALSSAEKIENEQTRPYKEALSYLDTLKQEVNAWQI